MICIDFVKELISINLNDEQGRMLWKKDGNGGGRAGSVLKVFVASFFVARKLKRFGRKGNL